MARSDRNKQAKEDLVKIFAVLIAILSVVFLFLAIIQGFNFASVVVGITSLIGIGVSYILLMGKKRNYWI